ncbi:MAG: RDD family protein [Deltaproteobacteria bacterium]|nr:RDD family protein [Deltaproteobacteria bacterium]
MESPQSRRSNIFLGERHTSLFNRLYAKSIDILIIAALFFLGQALWTPLGILAAMTYSITQDAMGSGQSIGKRIIGLRVVDDQTSMPCTIQASCLRNLVFALGVLFGAVQWLWLLLILIVIPLIALETYLILSIDSGVRLGDVIANTLVVERMEEMI